MLPWLAFTAALAQSDDPVLDALTAELDRTWTAWSAEEDAPYFLGYRVTEQRVWRIIARYGELATRRVHDGRMLDVVARVGDHSLDSSHDLKGGFVASSNFHVGAALPIDGSVAALQTAIWSSTNAEIRDAQERWLRVQANQAVKVEDLDRSADFSQEEPVVALMPIASLELDLDAWDKVLRDVSEILDDDPAVMASNASLVAVAETTWIVTSEGTRVREPRTAVRVALSASAIAEDGGEVDLTRWQVVHEPSSAPRLKTLKAWAVALRDEVVQQRNAALGQPYSGPVLLRGKAAGVFVHEVLGHRTEGHRQKDENEGQTFRDKVGDEILPRFVTIVDDPTVATYGGEDLAGHYAFDEEGVPAQRAVLVDRGTFSGFLLGRSPIEGFDHSNGHGRAQPGALPVARMGNTILETSRPSSERSLRQQMRQELRRQGQPWGLLVDEIDGGFTMTGRVMPNAFNVRAVTAYKIFADGRPDEPVRGVDLVGTPLVALANLIATGNDPAVFNGMCGAESGMVPVSAVAPSLLLRTLEVQKKEKGAERPPLLPKPTDGGDS